MVYGILMRIDSFKYLTRSFWKTFSTKMYCGCQSFVGYKLDRSNRRPIYLGTRRDIGRRVRPKNNIFCPKHTHIYTHADTIHIYIYILIISIVCLQNLRCDICSSSFFPLCI